MPQLKPLTTPKLCGVTGGFQFEYKKTTQSVSVQPSLWCCLTEQITFPELSFTVHFLVNGLSVSSGNSSYGFYTSICWLTDKSVLQLSASLPLICINAEYDSKNSYFMINFNFMIKVGVYVCAYEIEGKNPHCVEWWLLFSFSFFSLHLHHISNLSL